MDCFTDFYERLDIIQSAVGPIYEEGEGTFEDDISSDLTNGISEEYFDFVDQASTHLYSFYEKHIADSRMHQALHELVNTRRRKNYDDLKLVLMVDVIRAYNGLDHSTRLNAPEGIALLLLLVKLFRPDYFISFSGLKAIPSDIINLDGLVPYISACSEEIDIPHNESVISILLRQVHPRADKTYRQCLYYLFEVLSKVDGVVSQSETEYLMGLLRLENDDIK